MELKIFKWKQRIKQSLREILQLLLVDQRVKVCDSGRNSNLIQPPTQSSRVWEPPALQKVYVRNAHFITFPPIV